MAGDRTNELYIVRGGVRVGHVVIGGETAPLQPNEPIEISGSQTAAENGIGTVRRGQFNPVTRTFDIGNSSNGHSFTPDRTVPLGDNIRRDSDLGGRVFQGRPTLLNRLGF